jgi:2',3'-cyclic-nucleotide 2'-phosphodiesterase (5'-nucleotidase family)
MTPGTPRWPRARAAALAGAAAAACATPGPRPAPAAAPAPAPDTLTVVLAATTDVHGHLRAWDYFAARPDPAGSLAGAATIVDSLRRAHPGRVVLVDAGDMLQGTPLTDVAARQDTAAPHPVAAAMNAMGYDAAAVGNHEFNYGLALVARVRREARFPLLAANATTPDGRRAFPAYTVVERGGARVAVVGATTPGSMVWDRDHLRGRLVIGDVVRAVRQAADSARAAGADVVVAVLHSGLDEPSSYDTVGTGLPGENVAGRVAAEVPGLDAVVFGHSHRQLADSAPNGVLLVQPKNWAASVGVARLTLVRDARARGTPGRWRVLARRAALLPVRGRAEAPAVLAATEAAHGRAVAYVGSTLGTTPAAWRADSARVADAAVTDFVLEVMRRRSGAELAATAAFSLDAGLDSGAVTVAELARLYPYENTLRAVRVTGAQLRAFLEQSARYYQTYDAAAPGGPATAPDVPGYNFDVVAGADYALDLSRPPGQRVARLAVRGRPVADADTFTLALNNYRQTGGGGFAMLAGAPVVYDRGEQIRDLLIDEVRARGTVRPEQYHTVNWRIGPAAAVARAYAAMRPAGVAAAPGGGPRPAPADPVALRKDTPADAPAARTGRDPSAGAALPRRLRVLAVNDFHGALEPRPDAGGTLRGGAAPLAAAVARARAECAAPECVSVLLDGGDEFQGTPASNLAYGRNVARLFGLLGVDAAALGNHDLDWGRDTLRARAREVPYRVLAANARTAAGAPIPGTADDTLITRGALRVGVVGLASPETPTLTRAANTRGLAFGPMVPAFDARARALRARGAHVVLAVAHSGAFCDRRADSASAAVSPGGCEGEIVDFVNAAAEPPDAVVSGHTHSLVDARVRGVPVVQARSSGRALGVVDLVLDAGGRPIPDSTRSEVRDVTGPGDDGPEPVRALVRRSTAAVAELVGRPVAEVAEAMRRGPGEQYALGHLLADAQRWAGRGDVAVMNNGGIRADLRAGTATYGSLFEVQPFGNVLSRVAARGRDLRAYLEQIVGARRAARARERRGGGLRPGAAGRAADHPRRARWRRAHRRRPALLDRAQRLPGHRRRRARPGRARGLGDPAQHRGPRRARRLHEAAPAARAPARGGAAPRRGPPVSDAPGHAPDAAPRPAALRAFVNERGVDVAPGGTALDAVAAFDALAGHRAGRGRRGRRARRARQPRPPVDPAAPAHGGASTACSPRAGPPRPATTATRPNRSHDRQPRRPRPTRLPPGAGRPRPPRPPAQGRAALPPRRQRAPGDAPRARRRAGRGHAARHPRGARPTTCASTTPATLEEYLTASTSRSPCCRPRRRSSARRTSSPSTRPPRGCATWRCATRRRSTRAPGSTWPARSRRRSGASRAPSATPTWWRGCSCARSATSRRRSPSRRRRWPSSTARAAWWASTSRAARPGTRPRATRRRSSTRARTTWRAPATPARAPARRACATRCTAATATGWATARASSRTRRCSTTSPTGSCAWSAA